MILIMSRANSFQVKLTLYSKTSLKYVASISLQRVSHGLQFELSFIEKG